MKESHLFAVLLLTGGELAVSAAEGAETIFRQRTPVIDVERRVEQTAHRFKPVAALTGGKGGGKGTDQVGMAKGGVAQGRLLLAVLCRAR